MNKYQVKQDLENWFKTMQEEHNAKNPNYQVTDKQLLQFTKLILKTIDYNVDVSKNGIYTMQFISDVNYMWKDFTDDIKFGVIK